MQEEKPFPKSLLILLGIIIIAGGLWFYWGGGWPSGQPQIQEEQPEVVQQEENQITVNQVPTDKAPERFLDDIPIEERAKILQNYNAEAPDGRFQATRVFESTKTLDQNLAIYESYFKKGGWTITNKITDQPNVRYVSAAKEKTRAQATIRENTATKVVTVDVSVTYLP